MNIRFEGINLTKTITEYSVVFQIDSNKLLHYSLCKEKFDEISEGQVEGLGVFFFWR